MKILFVNKFLYPRGGAETYFLKIGEELTRRGHEVEYFGMYDEKNTVFAYIRGNGTRFSDCYIDTYQKGFQFGSGQYVVYITNLKWYVASNAWPTGLTAYVFPASPAGNTMYKVFNADINGAGVTRFSDEDLSTQTNCRWYGIVHNLSDAPSTLQ